MRRSQRPADGSPRPADVTTSGDQQGTPELPRLDEPSFQSDQVARRAYERYEARGRGDGRDMEDWFEAERELRQSASSTDTTRADDGPARAD